MALEDAHWRDSARSARFFIVDYRAAFPILILLLHIRIWTAVFALVAIVFFAALERYGFTLPVFVRLVRTWFAGSRKLARPWWKY